MIKNLALATLFALSPYKEIQNGSFNITLEKNNTVAINTVNNIFSNQDGYYTFYSYNNDSNWQNVGSMKTYNRAITSVWYRPTENGLCNIYMDYVRITIEKLDRTGSVEYTKTTNNNAQIQTQNFYHRVMAGKSNEYDDGTVTQMYNAFNHTYTNITDIRNQITIIDQNFNVYGEGADYLYDYTWTEQGYANTFNYLPTTNETETRELETNDPQAQSLIGYAYTYALTIYNVEISSLTQNQITIYNNTFEGANTTINYSGTYIADLPQPTAEIVDIPGIMFTVLGMPFAWISTAFNLTIFPGTPYAVNLSHLFFTLIFVAVLIFVIKKIFSR